MLPLYESLAFVTFSGGFLAKFRPFKLSMSEQDAWALYSFQPPFLGFAVLGLYFVFISS